MSEQEPNGAPKPKVKSKSKIKPKAAPKGTERKRRYFSLKDRIKREMDFIKKQDSEIKACEGRKKAATTRIINLQKRINTQKAIEAKDETHRKEIEALRKQQASLL